MEIRSDSSNKKQKLFGIRSAITGNVSDEFFHSKMDAKKVRDELISQKFSKEETEKLMARNGHLPFVVTYGPDHYRFKL